MKMTPALVVIGGLLVLWGSVIIVVVMPTITMQEDPSGAWRPWTADEERGHQLYVNNGCSYCHSMFVRVIDWDNERIAERGDYAKQNPAILGTERTGPDLSQEGGLHPDDWHVAHFTNPRNTNPMSLMPSWKFLGSENIRLLTAYVQALGGREADHRVGEQNKWKPQAIEARKAGADKNIAWLHEHVAAPWRPMPNPYPATTASLARGRHVYEGYCIGCHGLVGDGKGQAAVYLDPPPLNFTELRRNLVDGKYIGGILYYQVMNGITGTAMPLFKFQLESAKIWDVSNFVADRFIGYADSTNEPRGIGAAYEPKWTNPYKLPGEEKTKP